MTRQVSALLTAAAAAALLTTFHAHAAGQECEFHVSPVFIDAGVAAQTGTITVQTNPGCAWTAQVTPYGGGTFVSIDATAGTGPGTITYRVPAMGPSDISFSPIQQNRIKVRWNTPTLGQDVVITQSAGCRAIVTPGHGPISSQTFGAVASSGYIDFDPEFFNAWRVSSAPDWITFLSPPLGILGAGPSADFFFVAPNPSPEPRDGTIVACGGPGVPGARFPVHQAGRTPQTGRYVRGDFDGDGKADLTIVRPVCVIADPTSDFPTCASSSFWFVLQSHTGYAQESALTFALRSDSQHTLAADLDGDGVSDLVTMNTTPDPRFGDLADFWDSRLSSNGYDNATAIRFQFGPVVPPVLSDAIPLVADFAGHGRDDLAIFSPARTGIWDVLFSSAVLDPVAGRRRFAPDWLPLPFPFGTTGDTPLAADYDGDGKADIAVWHPGHTGTFYLLLSSAGYHEIPFGTTGDVAVSGDFDGDRLADPAVWRPSTGVWNIQLSSTGYTTSIDRQFGTDGDIPVPLDYDGDGRTDIAVWRPSTGIWFLLFSSTGFSTGRVIQWGNGALGDKPLGR